MAIACEPYIRNKGKYTGIDIKKRDIEFCKKYYPKTNFEFKHLNISNPVYAPKQPIEKVKWDIPKNSMDMITALSVWTHLNEDDAIFYFSEIDRVLKPKSNAIVTFFILDDIYYKTLKNRTDEMGRYHNTNQKLWIFDRNCSKSNNWFTTSWVKKPENAIAVTESGIQSMIKKTRLVLMEKYMGNWKEIPGIFFQDVLIFKKEH